MTMQTAIRGSAPVGAMDDLDPVRRAAVVALRRWCDGPAARADVCNEAAAALGPSRGRQWLAAFEQMLALIGAFARRPVVHHSAGCPCVGADESALAEMIAAAAACEREDAMLIGMVLVRPDMAPALANQAATVGHGLARMARHPGIAKAPVACH